MGKAHMNKPLIFIAAITALCSSTSFASETNLKTYGWVEFAEIQPWGIKVKAKLDSGALTSSMQAEDIETFERGEKNWVRFTLEVEDEASDDLISKTVERPVYRDFNASGAGGEDYRKVVLMKVCIGNTVYEEQFSLEDRDDMIYPVLLGRRTIQALGKIDVTQTFANDPECDENAPVSLHRDKQNDDDIGI